MDRPDGSPDPRVAFVVGGSGAIGEAIARRLARNGTTVYVGGNSRMDRAGAIAQEIRHLGGRADSLRADIRDSAAVGAAFEAVLKGEGRLDILVNAAGLNLESPVAGMEDQVWRDVVDTNLTGAFNLVREAARFMIPKRWGRIVTISSAAASRGGRGQANYAASKAAVEALTRVAAVEFGRKGITVNCVAPGVIETGMSERIRRDYGEQIMEHVALRRFGSPEDVAALVDFLCSEDAGYITGQVCRVDGGLGL